MRPIAFSWIMMGVEFEIIDILEGAEPNALYALYV